MIILSSNHERPQGLATENKTVSQQIKWSAESSEIPPEVPAAPI